MNVSLTPQLEAMIRQKVESGRDNNASEVVRDARRHMEASKHRLFDLRAAVAVDEGQIARGRVVEWTPELHAEIMQRAREVAGAGKQPKAIVCP